MNFNDIKNSFFKSIYHIENDILCVFDVKSYSKNEISELTLKSKDIVGSGFLFQTSGTTSDKKFVLHSFESLKTSCLAVNSWVGVNSKDKFLAPISIHHMGGFSVLARNYFFNSSEAIILKNWDINTFVKTIQDYKITISSLVPSQVYEIVQNEIKAPHFLKAIFVGGSGIDSSIFNKAIELGWPLLKTFGSSEACSQVFTQKVSSQTQGLELLPHWVFKLDQENRLYIKGKSLFSGYLSLKNETSELDILQKNNFKSNENKDKSNLGQFVHFEPIHFDSDGFFQTEDYVKCDNNVLVKFLGRSNDFIKVNSFLVNVNNLRQRFYDFLGQNQYDSRGLVLVETEDLKSGYKFVVISENIDLKLSNLIQAWNKQSKSYESILGIYFIEKLPTTELGKFKYQEIKKLINK